MNYPQVMVELAHLLADAEETARAAAARAIGFAGPDEVRLPLLRFKC